VHALLYLACHWSVGVAAAVRFVRVPSIAQATHVRVRPGTFGGGAEIVPLAPRPSYDRPGATEPVFDYRRARFVWAPGAVAAGGGGGAAPGGGGGAAAATTTPSTTTGAFAPLPYPDTATLSTYAKAAGVGDRAPAAAAAWGPNAISVPVPAFTALLADQLRAPFFVFQLLCVGLWCLDEYWYYSLFTLAMLIMFESTVAGQRLKNLRDLRGLQAPKPLCLVKRGGAWVGIRGEGVVPGDLISVGARPPAAEGPYVKKKAGSGGGAAAGAAGGRAQPANPAHAGADDAAIPADALLLAGSVVVEEAVLTGESAPQWKAPLYESAAAAAAAAAADGVGGAAPKTPSSSSPSSSSFAEVTNADLSSRLDAKRHRPHILYGGTTVLQHAPDPGAHDPPPDGGCLAVVLRTGYETAQGRLMRTILHAHAGDRVTANSWEAGAFICLLLVFALAAAGYVLRAGLADPGRDRFKLYLNCVMIVTSVVPPELPMELTIAVNASLVALARCGIWCTEPFRIPLAGGVHVACFDKTGTLTSDEMVLEGVAVCGGGGEGRTTQAGAPFPPPSSPPRTRPCPPAASWPPAIPLWPPPAGRAAWRATHWNGPPSRRRGGTWWARARCGRRAAAAAAAAAPASRSPSCAATTSPPLCAAWRPWWPPTTGRPASPSSRARPKRWRAFWATCRPGMEPRTPRLPPGAAASLPWPTSPCSPAAAPRCRQAPPGPCPAPLPRPA